jgi:hypothetical protein
MSRTPRQSRQHHGYTDHGTTIVSISGSHQSDTKDAPPKSERSARVSHGDLQPSARLQARSATRLRRCGIRTARGVRSGRTVRSRSGSGRAARQSRAVSCTGVVAMVTRSPSSGGAPSGPHVPCGDRLRYQKSHVLVLSGGILGSGMAGRGRSTASGCAHRIPRTTGVSVRRRRRRVSTP